MAQIDIEEVIYHLRTEIRRALADAVERTIPDAEFNDRELFRAFKRAVRRKCHGWEDVPDQLVKKR